MTARISRVIALLAFAWGCGDETLELGSRYLFAARISASAGGGFILEEGDAPGFGGVGIAVDPGGLGQDASLFAEPAEPLPPLEGVTWVGPAVRFGPGDLSVRATLRLRAEVPAGDVRFPVVGQGNGAVRDARVAEGPVFTVPVEALGVFQPGLVEVPRACMTSPDCRPTTYCDAARATCLPAPPCTSDRECQEPYRCHSRLQLCR